MRRKRDEAIARAGEAVGRRETRVDKGVIIRLKLNHLRLFGEFDVATLIYAKFKSAIEQTVTRLQLLPFAVEGADEDAAASDEAGSAYEYEPDEEAVLNYLLPRNVAVQVYNGLLENAASEHGARMTAMDNATRNAGDMINALTLLYNRSRQAQITKELIEIVSGAEAL